MVRTLSVITLVLLLLTTGCGLTIRYGGESFREAVGGHMVLGGLTLASMVVLLVFAFRQ